jgi:hypothetical protein
VSEPLDHQPFWCEENAWRLCRHARLAAREALVVVIASDGGAVRVRHQRAADGDAVDWDYHVIALARERGAAWEAWDLDTTLGCPLPALAYLDAAFAPPIPAELAPRFRLIGAADYLARLSSDRSHMRARDGSWLQPPPPWPAIVQGPTNLRQLIDPRWRGIGEVVDLDELRARLV